MVLAMKACLIFLLLGASAGSALAQYKCTAPDGKITFQQEPCVGAKAEEKMVVVPNGHPPPASGVRPAAVIVQTTASAVVGKVETNIDKKMLQRYEIMRQRDALAQALQKAQEDKASRGRQKLEAAAAARKQFGDDPANAAALKEALVSVNNRYDAMAELDDSRIRDAQAKLDAWDKAQAPARK